ncbi:hypothetical protein [Streptomyces microflavus]|uniref:hypothetical protein n=1 Tax=Streptomyces microflavus TaxID=1919 RepID=UPI003401D2EB
MHRRESRKNDKDAKTAEANTYVVSVQTVTDGFTQLLEQQRATNSQTLDRVATLETKQTALERKVEVLEEEQRQWRRWKAAALDYIRDLRALVAKAMNRPAPDPPEEIAPDITGSDWS